MQESVPIPRRRRHVTEGLHRARLDQGYTIRALAREVRVNEQYLSRVEVGSKRPGAGLLLRLADTLNVSLDDISAVEEPPAERAA